MHSAHTCIPYVGQYEFWEFKGPAFTTRICLVLLEGPLFFYLSNNRLQACIQILPPSILQPSLDNPLHSNVGHNTEEKKICRYFGFIVTFIPHRRGKISNLKIIFHTYQKTQIIAHNCYWLLFNRFLLFLGLDIVFVTMGCCFEILQLC